ncbi:MAG: tail fiber domain-containing protein [Bacteroidota bacterium]
MKHILFISLTFCLSNFLFAQNPPRLSVAGDANIDGNIFIGQTPPTAPPVDPDCGTPAFTGPDCLPIVKANIYDDVLIYGRLLLRDGGNNTFIGNEAAKANTTGIENIAIGLNALFENTTKSNLIAIGDSALYRNGVNPTGGIPTSTQSIDNLAIGSSALFANTLGSGNLALGRFALTSNTNGNCNVATGKDAMKSHTGGSWNVAYGCGAMIEHEMGEGNTAIGHEALDRIENGDYNTSVGYRAHLNGIVGQTVNYSTVVGANAETSGSNTVILGNSNAITIGGYQEWSNVSDQRLKTRIKQNVPGLSFINALKPVTYQMDMEAIGKTRKHTPVNEFWRQSALAKGKVRYTGFLAQEVEAVAAEIGYDFSGVDKPQNESDHYKLRYATFVVPLVKAVQELSESNSMKDAKIEALEARLAKIESLLSNNSKAAGNASSSLDAAQLEQNAPNPFTVDTKINYFIPAGVQDARLQIVDATGKLVKNVQLNNDGQGQLILAANLLDAGIYSYTLLLDGIVAMTKKMVLTQ